jgi:DNA-binding IclR family transcriptional regulator
MAENGGSAGVRSVQLAIDVLEAVVFSDAELGVTQIADRLNATKGSVHRHLVTLVERGYLSQNPDTSRYAIGPKSRVLARLAPNTDLVALAEAPMRDLRDALGHTVVLSEITPRGALVLAKLASISPIEIGVRPGSELAFHATAQGKILLAFAPPAFRERALARPLEPFTGKTIVTRQRVEAALHNVVKSGYASAPEEAMLGINALAAPVFDHGGACVGALAIVGSIQFLPAMPRPGDVSALKDAGQQISRKLGYGRGSDATSADHRARRR